MSWIKKEFPTIRGYESLGDTIEAKRWLDFRISQLLDTGDPLWEYRGVLKARKDVCDFVIMEFDYPLSMGLPTDNHYNNWFCSNCCHCITQDFWQMASETLRTLRLNQRQGRKGVGDCEDVSVLFTTLFLMKRWEAYECLGYVLLDNEMLGGHGWSIFKDEDGVWRLMEATLSEAPKYPNGYPAISPDETEWKVGDITYRAFVKFNRHEYYENEEEYYQGAATAMDALLRVRLKAKETRRKYEAISRAWHQKAKPLTKLGLLSRLRWR